MAKKFYASPVVVDFGSAVGATLGSPGISVEALNKRP
jgi:hypothetical protein